MKLRRVGYLYLVPVGLALLSLCLGTLVYLTRPAGAPFLPTSSGLPPLFGPLGGPLPSLTHALSFTLLSAAVLGVTRRSALFTAALWLIIEFAFEVGQHPLVTTQLDRLGLGLRYFHSGTFDPFDLAACFVGTLLALLILRIWVEKDA